MALPEIRFRASDVQKEAQAEIDASLTQWSDGTMFCRLASPCVGYQSFAVCRRSISDGVFRSQRIMTKLR